MESNADVALWQKVYGMKTNISAIQEGGKWTDSTRDLISSRFSQFLKFCFVGGSGTIVDTGLLFLLANPRMLGLNLIASKFCAAEVALLNNFAWNEVWTFRQVCTGRKTRRSVLKRLLFFNAVCGVGIFFSVLLLKLFHGGFGWNLYVSNLLVIAIVTLWNFGLNSRLNWRSATRNGIF